MKIPSKLGPAQKLVLKGLQARIQKSVDVDGLIEKAKSTVSAVKTAAAAAVPPAPAKIDGDLHELNEDRRTYTFADGATVVFTDVRELIVRKSGTHRLRTEDGKIHVIAKGWLAITVDDKTEDWTV